MKSKRKLKLLAAFIALIICITQIQQTYAKYIDVKEGNTDFTIAKWKILVNNQDITDSSTMSSLINPVYIENDNIKDGVIAPGSEGYFDIEIDSTNTEVSFTYTITLSNTDENNIKDLKITGYSQNGSAIIPLDNQINSITDTVYYTDTNRLDTIRIYFTWLDGNGETMDNTSDTNASISGESAKLKVNMAFIQTLN